MAPLEQKKHSFCNLCQHQTNHSILGEHSREIREGNDAFPQITFQAWNVLQCLGCQSIKVSVVETSPDSKNHRETHYPAINCRSIPNWEQHLPQLFRDLIREVYTALNAECLCLSTIGTRTLVDTMLTELVGDVGGFAKKLDNAVKSGFFTDNQKQKINVAVEAGNAASHRGFRPTPEQFFDVLEIVEHALKDYYVIGKLSSRLTSAVPPRAAGGT